MSNDSKHNLTDAQRTHPLRAYPTPDSRRKLTPDSRRTLTPDSRRTVKWSGHSADELASRCGVPRVELLAETDSTQDVVHGLAEQLAPAGTVVVADAQRAGRGRFGRTWRSEPGQGVWCTVLERPNPGGLAVLSLRVGLHCAEALDGFASSNVGVKWPNDLTLSSDFIPTLSEAKRRDLRLKKLGGVLVEARWSGAMLAWVAIGVGINVRQPNVSGAAGLRADTDRADVLVAIVRAVRAAAASLGELTRVELDRYAARDVLAGCAIVSPVAGTVAGITANGALVVNTTSGVEHVRAGTIRLAEEEAS